MHPGAGSFCATDSQKLHVFIWDTYHHVVERELRCGAHLPPSQSAVAKLSNDTPEDVIRRSVCDVSIASYCCNEFAERWATRPYRYSPCLNRLAYKFPYTPTENFLEIFKSQQQVAVSKPQSKTTISHVHTSNVIHVHQKLSKSLSSLK